MFIPVVCFSSTTRGHSMLIDEFTDNENICYAVAMIGYDSVINSRSGTTIEVSLKMISQRTDIAEHHPLNRIPLLSTVLGAYLWKGAAHTYAIKTFSKCITNKDNWK